MGLVRAAVGICLSLAVIAAVTAPARAEEWAPSAVTNAGEVFDLDLSTITVTGSIAKSWMRDTPPRPQKDPGSGKAYATTVLERSDDCEHRRFALGSYIRRDRKGRVTDTGSAGAGWQPIAPGSIAEAVWTTACRAVSPPDDEPIFPDILEGDWTSLGLSADKSYYLSMRTDNVVKMDDQHAVVAFRSDYTSYQRMAGYPIKHNLQLIVLDCADQTSAVYRTDLYMSASIRAISNKATKLDFQPAAPGSFLSRAIQPACAAARPAGGEEDADEPEPGSVAFGTAWGVDKGYLVTASHVISHGKSIAVYSEGQQIGRAKVVADDPANDLAILKFTSGPARLQVFALAEKSPALGRNVFTLGYPAPETMGQKIKMTAGQVSGAAGQQDDARFLQISVPIQPGNSGGPLITWDGTVAGVIDSKLTRFEGDRSTPAPEAVNYAVKVSYVRPMLEDLPDLGNYTVVHAAGGADDLVAAARKAVFMLVVSY